MSALCGSGKNCRVTIDLEALLRNLRILTAEAARRGCRGRGIAVLKADAYGHGAAAVATALRHAGVGRFAVASVAEGAALRRVLPAEEILVLAPAPPEDLSLLIRARLIPTAASAGDLLALRHAVADAWKQGSLPLEKPIPVHLKIDSGMHRLGFSVPCGRETAFGRAVLRITRAGGVLPVGAFSHLATADTKSPQGNACLRAQAEAFFRVAGALRRYGLCPTLHLANSAALLRFGSMGLPSYRMGIALYGIPPSEELPFVGDLAGMAPVMTVTGYLRRVFTLKKGETLGYGADFRAPADMRIGVLSVGYADGLLRASRGGFVSLHGRRVRIIGRICMDQCFLALEDTPAAVGDAVEIFGKENPAAALAAAAGTIPYELLTLVSRRAGREYLP